MSDSLNCDRCGAVGYRKLSHAAPTGWFFAEFKDEESGETYIIYACSLACTHINWQTGPGSLRTQPAVA